MPAFSPRVDRLRGEGAAAWRIHAAAGAARRRGEDVVILSVGDPDFATPSPIVEEAVAALRRGDTHYTEIAGRLALREAIAGYHTDMGGAAVGAENVVVTPGAQNALFATSMCLFSPGDEILVLDPMYVTYEATIRASGAGPVVVPPRPGGVFRPDLDALERAVTPRSRAIMFANPNNPSGVVMTADELAGIAAAARRHDLWVVADEVYAALTFDAPHLGIDSLPGMQERTVTVSSLSKSQAMTGWRCGWLVGPQPLAQHAENLVLCMLYGMPGFVQEAAVAALTRDRGEMQVMRDVYRRRRDLVHGALSALPELAVVNPQAGMFVLVDIRATGMSSHDFAWNLFRAEGVSVLDAAAFGSSADGFVRISYTLGEAALAEGCRRIRRFVESCRPSAESSAGT